MPGIGLLWSSTPSALEYSVQFGSDSQGTLSDLLAEQLFWGMLIQ